MLDNHIATADHYFRVVVQNPLFHCLTRDEPRPIYDAAKTVIENLSDEDRTFIDTIYSHFYDPSHDTKYLYGDDGQKWRTRLYELYELFAKTAGLIK